MWSFAYFYFSLTRFDYYSILCGPLLTLSTNINATLDVSGFGTRIEPVKLDPFAQVIWINWKGLGCFIENCGILI